VPTSIYFKDGYAKIEIAVAKGRKAHDKREAIKERMAKRESEVAVGRRNKGI
jgi:SsrA-binding protein